MTDPAGLAVEGAIQQVLDAEEWAMAAVDRSRVEAEGILLEARRRAAELAAESDLNISAIHKEMAKKTRKQVQEITLEYQRRVAFEGSAAGHDVELETAVARLASRLTGGENPLLVDGPADAEPAGADPVPEERAGEGGAATE